MVLSPSPRGAALRDSPAHEGSQFALIACDVYIKQSTEAADRGTVTQLIVPGVEILDLTVVGGKTNSNL